MNVIITRFYQLLIDECCGIVGAVVIATALLHSTDCEFWFCAGSNLSCGMLEICDDEDI